jgi:hypothetical protein
MAILHSIQSGNFTSASTWGVVDPTSYLDSRAGSNSTNTIQTNSSVAFTPGAITISGVAIQIFGRATTGTVTMRLWNTTANAVVKDVTINVSDLAATGAVASPYIGWTYFKFDTSVTLLAGNAYVIRMFSSVNNQVSVYTNGTTSNYSRALVTTTTAAPAATDTIITGGDFISVGVNTTTTVTMNSTSLATQYANCYVGSRGVFNYGIASSTNYGLRLAGDIWIGRSGTFTIGTVTNPIPATSTAVLEINCASALQFQIYNFGTFETKHATTVLHRALLNADIVVGSTTMTTNVSTGWKQNDVIVIPSTTRTTSQHERVTLNTNASGTTLTHNATSFAHDGNATIYIQADLANLTRSIKIRSVTNTFRSRFQQGLNGVTTLFDVEFFEWAGCIHNSGTAIYAGSFNLQQCTFWGTINANTVLSNVYTISNTISNNVFWNYIDAVQNIDDNNLIIGLTSFYAWSGVIGNNNVITSCAAAGTDRVGKNNSTGNRFYATGGNGAIYAGSNSANIVSNYVFFNNAVAIRYVSSGSTTGSDRTAFEKFENCYFYGNVFNIDIISSGVTTGGKKLWFNNCFFWGGKTGLITAIGYSAIISDYTHFSNCTFGRRPDGVDSLFSTSCLRGGQVGTTLTNSLFYGTQSSFASTTQFTSVNGFNGVTSLKHNGVTNEYRQYQANGFIQNDNVITYNGLPTIRITPVIATNKTFSNPVRVAVQSGQTCNVSLVIRKSVLGDGSTYNGNQPRLMYAFNPLAGNLTETIANSYPDYNLLSQGQNLENAVWTKQRTTIGQNVILAPDGTLTADNVIANGGVTYSYTGTLGINILSNSFVEFLGTRSVSVYLKYNGLNRVRFIYGSTSVLNTNIYVEVDLQTGTIIETRLNNGGPDLATNPFIEDTGDGWYRVGFNLIASITPTNNRLAVALGDTTKTIANGVDGVYVWGFQMTDGSQLRPYVSEGSWQTISYTTPTISHDCVLEFYVDCDGTTGWINIDDFKTTTSNDTRGMNYWSSIGVYSEPDWRRPGGSVTFVS